MYLSQSFRMIAFVRRFSNLSRTFNATVPMLVGPRSKADRTRLRPILTAATVLPICFTVSNKPMSNRATPSEQAEIRLTQIARQIWDCGIITL